MASNIIAALKNEPLIVGGDGEQSSDFVYVDDIVNGILIRKESAIGQVCDLGTGIDTPIKRIAEMIIEITKSKSKIEYVPLRTGEVKLHTKADLTNAKKYLGWEPKISLEEGIRKTIPYYAKLVGVKSPV